MSSSANPRDVNLALCRLLGIDDVRDVTEVVVRVRPGMFPTVEVTRAPPVLRHVVGGSQAFVLVPLAAAQAGAHRPAASCGVGAGGVGAVGDACRVPPVYLPAAVRCVLPVCTSSQSLGVAFNVEDGSGPVRLRLSVADADALVELLQGYISSAAGLQSPASELMPSEPRSVPSEGEKVYPPDKSSIA